MGRLVTDAQNGKAPVQRLADRVSAVFVPAVLVIAALTLAAWLAARAVGVGRVHRRRRGADHRLPVRARAGHADRDPGRHRPRRPARDPVQGSRRCSSHRDGHRHRRARQDRHRHHRRDGRWSTSSRGPARTPTRCWRGPPRSRPRPNIPSPRPIVARRPRPRTDRRTAVTRLRQRTGHRRRPAWSTARRVTVARLGLARRRSTCRRCRARPGTAVEVAWDGRVRGVIAAGRRGQAHQRRGRRRADGHGDHARCC